MQIFIILVMRAMKWKDEEPLYCFLFTLVTLAATKGINSALLLKGCIAQCAHCTVGSPSI